MFGAPDKKKGSLALMILGGKPKGMGMGAGDDADSDRGAEPDDAREGLESAADDIMTAIKQDDGHGFVDAMLSFIELAKGANRKAADDDPNADDGEDE